MGDAGDQQAQRPSAAAAGAPQADPPAGDSNHTKEGDQGGMGCHDPSEDAAAGVGDGRESAPDFPGTVAVAAGADGPNAAGDPSDPKQEAERGGDADAEAEAAAAEPANGANTQMGTDAKDDVSAAEDKAPGDGEGEGEGTADETGSQDAPLRCISWNAWKGPGPEPGAEGSLASGDEEPLEEGEKRPSPPKELEEEATAEGAKKDSSGSRKGEGKEPGEHEQTRGLEKEREKSKELEKEKSKEKDKGSSRSSAQRSSKEKSKDKDRGGKDNDKDKDNKERDRGRSSREKDKDISRSSSSRRAGRTRSRSRSRSRSMSRNRRAEPFRRGRSPPVPYERRAQLEAQRRERENANRMRRPDEPSTGGTIYTRLQNRGGPAGYDNRSGPGVDRRMPGGFGGPSQWDDGPGMRPGGPYRPGAPVGNFGGQGNGWMGTPDGFRGRRRSPSPPMAAPFGMRRPVTGGPGRPGSPPGPRGGPGFGGPLAPAWDRPGPGPRGLPSPPRRGFGGGPGLGDYPGADYAFRQGHRPGEGPGPAPGQHAGEKRARDWRDEPEGRGRPGGPWPDRSASSPRGMRPGNTGGGPPGWSGREGGGLDAPWGDHGFRRTGSNGAMGGRGDMDQHWSPGSRPDMGGFSRGGGVSGPPHGRSGWQDNGGPPDAARQNMEPGHGRHEPAGLGRHEPAGLGRHEPAGLGRHEPAGLGRHEPVSHGRHESSGHDYARAQTHGLQQQQQQRQSANGIGIGSIQTQEWYYTDPQGETQGPCSIAEFSEWLTTLGADPNYRDEYLKFKDARVFKQGSAQTILLEHLVQQAQSLSGRH